MEGLPFENDDSFGSFMDDIVGPHLTGIAGPRNLDLVGPADMQSFSFHLRMKRRKATRSDGLVEDS